MTSLEGFLTRLFCSDFGAGFILRLAGTFFFGVRIFTVRFLALTGVFLKDSNVPFMPAWAIDTAFWTSSMRLFIPIPHHDRAAQLSLALTIEDLRPWTAGIIAWCERHLDQLPSLCRAGLASRSTVAFIPREDNPDRMRLQSLR